MKAWPWFVLLLLVLDGSIAADEAQEILRQVEFGSRILATPAVVGGRIYLRTSKHLFAFGN